MRRQSRPNILVIMSDEHDPAVTGCYGDPVIRTPHLDGLANEGITFDRCYTTSPLCVPARLSFTAGKYVSRCGAWNNACDLPSPDYPSLPRILNAEGYQSYLCGKMHYTPEHRFGFEDLLPGSGNHCSGNRKEVRRAPDEGSETSNKGLGWESRTANFFVGDEDQSPIMRNDVARTERTRQFIRGRSLDDPPFFLTLGYIAPHFPLIAPKAYHDIYKDQIPMPELPSDWFERLPTNYQQLIYGFGIDRNDREVKKLGRELYWALTSWMDTEIGKVLDTLYGSRVAENTIVIYTSDHGENKGDHGMWWKNNMFEHASRIPLIVRWPERWAGGQRRLEACSLVDLVRTIAEIGGAACPKDWDGDTMLRWMDDETTGWKDLAVSEYYAHNISSGFAMLRQGSYKYVYHTRMNEAYGPERELYNLDDDPGEWNNLAAGSEHDERIRSMHDLLVTELGRDPEACESECRADMAAANARGE